MAAVAEAVDRMEMTSRPGAVKGAQDARRVIALVVLAAIVLAALGGTALYHYISGPSSGKESASSPPDGEGTGREGEISRQSFTTRISLG
jgi:hypothetical protein